MVPDAIPPGHEGGGIGRLAPGLAVAELHERGRPHCDRTGSHWLMMVNDG